MRYLKHISEQAELFNALGSEVRLQILNLLQAKGRMSMNELADKLGLSQGALTPHIRKLESADLVRINQDAMVHGNMKMCEPHLDKIFLVFSQETTRQNEYASHIRVGQYSSCEIYPTCGISTEKSIIGEVDDPRYFTHQKRFEADILWFTRGFVEYMVPCIIPRSSRITLFFLERDAVGTMDQPRRLWRCPGPFYTGLVAVQLESVWTVKNTDSQ